MIISVTGTPGTGKTEVARNLAEMLDFLYVDLNKFSEENNLVEGVDKERGSMIIDGKKLSKKVEEKINKNAVLDGHLSHFCKSDVVVVLRTKPDVLEKRLSKRGWDEKKIKENVMAETLDSCLIESTEKNEKVIEIDTTDDWALGVAEKIRKILDDGNYDDYKPGQVDWSGYIE